jgi:DNA polymerase III alpha subunit (gram-positive type)
MTNNFPENQVFIVVDIEADGPNPGYNSMLSIGAVATDQTETVDKFYAKIQPLDELTPNADTMRWWQTQPDAWAEVTTDAQPAEQVMRQFLTWANQFHEPIFVAHPIAFDYAFVEWYMVKFLDQNPFKLHKDDVFCLNTLDLQTFIAGKFGLSLWQAHRTNLPNWATEGMPEHSHNALDDAKGYAAILRNALNRGRQ